MWMNNPHSGYNRIIHIHRNRDFGFGEESTSHIESIWADIKRMLIGIYTTVRSENIVFFIKDILEKTDIEDFTKNDYEDYLEKSEESDDDNNLMYIDL